MLVKQTTEQPTQLHIWPTLFLFAGVMLIAWLVYWPTLAPTITWQHGGADSGDLAAAVATLGVAHPPGYPTYILLGYLWTALPFGGDLAYRLNLMSATGAALAAGLTALTIAKGAPNRQLTPIIIMGSMAGGFLLALSPLMWSQAIIAEVYAPGLAMVALVGWLLFQPASGRTEGHPTGAKLFGIGILSGLAYGLVPQIILVGPGMLFILITYKEMRHPSKNVRLILKQRLMPLIIGGLIGLTIFVYLPLRAATQPLVNWGDPSTPARFWAMVTVSGYQQYTQLLTPNEWVDRLVDSLLQITHNLTGAGILLAGLGSYHLWRGNRAILGYLTSLIGLTILFRTSYPVSGNIVYLLPAIYGVSLLAGWGVCQLLMTAQRYLDNRLVSLMGLGFIVTLFIRSLLLTPQFDLSHDKQAAHFGEQTLAHLPPQAIVISNRDATTFSLWYQQALDNRPEVIVIDQRLWAFEWYRHHLQHRYPDLYTTSRPIFKLAGQPGQETLELAKSYNQIEEVLN